LALSAKVPIDLSYNRDGTHRYAAPEWDGIDVGGGIFAGLASVELYQ
jgi:hypothetical protein